MKKGIFLFLTAFVLGFIQTNAQVSGTYRIQGADTVKFLKNGGAINPNATEFVLQNNTDTVPGFLWNNGLGITKFKRPLKKINSNTYLIGIDTLIIPSGGGGSPGGVDMDIQFNLGGGFTGVHTFYFDSAKKTVVIGTSNTVNSGATNNFISGKSNISNGAYSAIFGFGNTTGLSSAVFGNGNTADNYSIAAGNNNLFTNFYSSTFGTNLFNTYPNALVIGQFNDTTSWPGAASASDISALPVFSIGNGINNSTRSNAFTVLRNGKIVLKYLNNATKDSVLTTDQFGNLIFIKPTGGGGGGGTLDSVGLKMPTGFTVSNSPQTGTGGTINVTTGLNGVVHAGSGAFTGSPIVDADVTNVGFSKIINTPTTVTGYGITNAVRTDQVYANPTFIGSLAWAKITGTPTTLSGYGITDPVVLTSGAYANPTWITQLAWSKITGTPTTIAGYGITDLLVNSINGRTGVVVMKNADSIKNLPVDTTINRNNYVLTFDSTNHKWFLSASGGTGASSFAGLTDVAITSPVNNQFPVYNSGTSKWTNTTVTTSIIGEGSNLYWTNARFLTAFKTETTDSLPEGTSNLYFTQARARNSISGTAPINYVAGTGVVSLNIGRGLAIGGGNLIADTAVLVTLSNLNGRTYLTSETDPVANAKTITITPVSLGGIVIGGSAGQTLGSSPVWTVRVDTTNLIPTYSFLNGNYLPVYPWTKDYIVNTNGHPLNLMSGALNLRTTAHSLGLTTSGINWVDSLNNFSSSIQAGSGSIFFLSYPNNNFVGGHQTMLYSDAAINFFNDSATKYTFNRNGVATFPGNVFGITAPLGDSTKKFGTTEWSYQNMIPMVWNMNRVVTGNNNSLHVLNGTLFFDSPTLHQRVGMGYNAIGLLDSTDGHGGSILLGPAGSTGFYMQVSPVFGHGIHVRGDSVLLYDDGATPFIFKATGDAVFNGHVTGVVESNSDSSARYITTAGVKRLLANYSPGASNILDIKRDFGAVGDGVTSDDTAFARAGRTSGATIVVPKGKYLLKKIISVQGSNLAFVGLGNDSSQLISAVGAANTFFIGRNVRHVSITGLYMTTQDTSKVKPPAFVLLQSDTTFTSLNRDSTALTDYVLVANNTFVGNSATSKMNGVAVIAHRSGWGAYVRHVRITNNRFFNLGASAAEALGEPTKEWLSDISFDNNVVRHTGLADTLLGFGVSYSGMSHDMYVGHNQFTDITQIGAEMAGANNSTVEYNQFDSCYRNKFTTPYSFNGRWTTGVPTSFGNRALHNMVLDSIVSFPYVLNQTDFYSEGNFIKAYGSDASVTTCYLIDSLRNGQFVGDFYNGRMFPRPTIYLRSGTSGVSFQNCKILGNNQQNQTILTTDSVSNNIFQSCTFGGNASDGTLITTDVKSFNNVVRNAFYLNKNTIGYSAGIPSTTTPNNIVVYDNNGRESLYPFSNIPGLVRIAPIDSLGRVANGLQAFGGTIVPQTADATHPGMESILHFKTTDSIANRTFRSLITLSHPGAGLWSAYSSLAGDSLYAKNFTTTGNGLSVIANADSSIAYGINYSFVAGVANTQTLTNKTLSAPLITGAQYENSSTTGYVWTATDNLGHASWQLATGAPNLTPSFTGNSFSISAGAGSATIPAATHSVAGAMSAAIAARVDSIIWVNNSGHGHTFARAPATKDSLVIRGADITGSGDIGVTYTGNKDSVSWALAFKRLTTNGDMLYYNNGNAKLPIGASGQVLTVVGGLPVWQTITGTGSVTNFASTGTVGTLFTTSVANPSTNVVQTITLTPTASNDQIWGKVGAAGTPGYFSPLLTSSLFANQGAVNTVYHGNAAGNGSFSAVSMVTDVTGLLQQAQFPALTGQVTTVAGSFATTIANSTVTNAQLAGGIDLTSKVTGILPPNLGGTGVNNGSNTVTLAGNFTTAGANALTLTTTGPTNVTLPTAGTLLTTTGSGAGLSGVVLSVGGTANQVLIGGTAQNPILSLPQNIHAGASPTFTGLTLTGSSVNFTGLATGSNTDNILTVTSGGVVRFTPPPIFVASGAYTPTLTNTTNITSSSITSGEAQIYTQIGNIVHVKLAVSVAATTANTLTTLTVSLPTTAGSINSVLRAGTGYWDFNGLNKPIAVEMGASNTAQISFFPTASGGPFSIVVTFDYSL